MSFQALCVSCLVSASLRIFSLGITTGITEHFFLTGKMCVCLCVCLQADVWMSVAFTLYRSSSGKAKSLICVELNFAERANIAPYLLYLSLSYVLISVVTEANLFSPNAHTLSHHILCFFSLIYTLSLLFSPSQFPLSLNICVVLGAEARLESFAHPSEGCSLQICALAL